MATGLRERKKEKTRDAMAGAALRLFGRRGFDGVTVEEIAAACDVSPRTFFRYFRSKEDVLFADGDRKRIALLAAIDAQAPDVGPLTAVEHAVRVVASDYASQPAAVRARRRILTTTPSLRTRSAEREQQWEADLIAHLRSSGRADGTSDLDLRLLVAATTTAFRVAVDAWVEAGDDGDLSDFLDAAFRRLRAGFEGSAV